MIKSYQNSESNTKPKYCHKHGKCYHDTSECRSNKSKNYDNAMDAVTIKTRKHISSLCLV